MERDLEGRVALVTGSSGGIGRAIGLELGRSGAAIIAHGRDPERTAASAEAFRQLGVDSHIALGPLDTDEGAEAVLAAVQEGPGPVDILVNNAGHFEVKSWNDADARRWLSVYNDNVGSTVRMVRALAPGMKERGWGRIIQVSSVSAVLAPPLFPDYAAAKAAILNLTATLAKDLAGSGVTVNTVSPGPVVTRTWESFALQIAEVQGWEPDLDATKAALLDSFLGNPSGRLGDPRDIAHAVAFLASPRAGYVNAVNLPVDGGLTARF